jgi:hypothetical protein
MSYSKDTLEMLLDERIDCALNRLRTYSPDYRTLSDRSFYLNEALQTLLSNQTASCNPCDKEMIREYLRLTDDICLQEERTIYLQGFLDCMASLSQTGWFPL